MSDAQFQLPVIRHFIACDRIETVPELKQYSLINVIHVIRLPAGVPFPRILPQIAFFAQMTNGRGRHEFRVEFVFVDVDKSTYQSATAIVELGSDPLVVHGWPIRLQNILFERPGLYECRLYCDGKEIAREPIVLRADA